MDTKGNRMETEETRNGHVMEYAWSRHIMDTERTRNGHLLDIKLTWNGHRTDTEWKQSRHATHTGQNGNGRDRTDMEKTCKIHRMET